MRRQRVRRKRRALPPLARSQGTRAFFPLTSIQRVRCWAAQAPGHPRGRIFKVNRTIHAAFRHRFHDYGAEASPLRRRYGRPIAFDPTHIEGVAIGSPADINTTPIHRKRPVFTSVGGQLMECEPDCLRGSWHHAQLWAIRGDTRTNEVGEVSELRAN
jgi:hypothetical protein